MGVDCPMKIATGLVEIVERDLVWAIALAADLADSERFVI